MDAHAFALATRRAAEEAKAGMADGAASSMAAPTASASDPGPAGSSAIFFVYVPPRGDWCLETVVFALRAA